MHALRDRLAGCWGLVVRVWGERRSRSFALAVLVAFALRLAWAIWATQSISVSTTDPAQYLAATRAFASLSTPEIYGNPTAFLPPGYPLFLEPFYALADLTGLVSANFAASLVNAVLGTVTVVLTARLAEEWIGARSRNIAAWIMALAAGHVFYTSVILSETLFATMTMAILYAATVLVRRSGDLPRRKLLILGVFIGWAMLVRTPGAVLVLAPALTLRATHGSWSGAARTIGWVLLGTLVLLVPWTVRNAVEVGVAVPISTNNAAFLCGGHSDYATGGFDRTPEALEHCYGGGPYDRDDADEPRWYRETTSEAIGWAVRHPIDEVRLTFWKTYLTMADDGQALSDAEDFGAQPLASDRWRAVLRTLANGWHWGVLAFAAAGLWWVRACRRALPLWVTAVAYLVAVWGGLALPRYHHAIMPILVVFAAAAVVAVARPEDAAQTAEVPAR